MGELSDALETIDRSPELKVAVLTGSEKSFAGKRVSKSPIWLEILS